MNPEKKEEAHVDKSSCPSIYHLVKKNSTASLESLRTLLNEAEKAGLASSSINSKGKGGLHASFECERWDFAKEFLERGSDPLKKDKFGKSFFLLLVKKEDAPWRDVLASREDLIRRHERHMAEKEEGNEMFRRRDRSSCRRKEHQGATRDTTEIQKTLLVAHPRTGESVSLGALFDDLMSDLRKEPSACLDFVRAGGHPGFEKEGVTFGLALTRLGKEAMSKVQAAGGWSWDVPNIAGERPLTLAAKEGWFDVLRFLLNVDASPNETDGEGNTPLHLAAERGDESMVEFLLSYGADAGAKNEVGETPAQKARKVGSQECVDILSEAKGFSQNATFSSGRKGGQRRKNRKGQEPVRRSSLDIPLPEAKDEVVSLKGLSLLEKKKEGKGPVIIVRKSRVPSFPIDE